MTELPSSASSKWRVLLVLTLVAFGGRSGGAPAYHLEKGSLARDRVVAIGRDLIVEGEVLTHAVAIDGSARIDGTVQGDVVVMGGDVTLGPDSRCGGDVFVLGGVIHTNPGAEIAGRSVAYPDSSALWLTMLEGPTLGLPATAPVVLGAKAALLAFWALLLASIFAVGRVELVSTSEGVRQEPFRNFLVGLTAVAAMTLTALFFATFSGVFLGVPLLVLVAVVALCLRFWGMVAVFHALGLWLHGHFSKRASMPVTTATYGLIALGIVKFIPFLGVWSWTAATFIGVGATLTTKFGRRQPWFEVAEEPR